MKCNIFPPFRKVFGWFFNLCGVNQNASVCLFSPPLSQSAIFPFDLLFIRLSLCTTRLFILHFNIWWGHLWSWECSGGVILVDKSFVSVCSFANYCQDWSIFLKILLIAPFKLFDLKRKHPNSFPSCLVQHWNLIIFLCHLFQKKTPLTHILYH